MDLFQRPLNQELTAYLELPQSPYTVVVVDVGGTVEVENLETSKPKAPNTQLPIFPAFLLTVGIGPGIIPIESGAGL